MPKFKASVSKWTSRFDVVITSENIEKAKQRLHKEWYSILTLNEDNNIKIDWKKFYFIASFGWEKKSWTIAWEDIFKSYLKLRDEFSYDVDYLFDNKDATQDEKIALIASLKEQYNTYKTLNSKQDIFNISKKQREEDKKKNNEKQKDSIFNNTKKVEEMQVNIDFVIKKINRITNSSMSSSLNKEKIENLIKLKEGLSKFKSSTNTQKLKDIWEKALLKVWEIELLMMEKTKKTAYLDNIKETNKLLKWLWSKLQIKKENNITSYIKTFFENNKNKLKRQEKKQEIDKNSYDYFKTINLLNKYEKLLSKHRINYIKYLYLYFIPTEKNKAEIFKIFSKTQVLKRNISLLKTKVYWNTFSYTKFKRWYDITLEKILFIVKILKNSSFLVILMYSALLIISFILSGFFIDFNISKELILNLIILEFLSLILIFVRNLFSLWLNFAIFGFFVIIALVNF